MKRTWHLRSLLALVALLLSLVPLATGPAKAAAADAAKFNPPKQYYLALGDSLAYGYQEAKFQAEKPNIDPATFNTGYVDDFAAQLQQIRPGIVTTNYGCVGETTTTFLNGGCDWPKALLHNGYPDSQKQAALDFLAQHPGQVSPITIDIGANDVVSPIQKCLQMTDQQAQQECLSGIPSLVSSAVTNLADILSRLRAAAPYSEIIVMQYYNPFAAVAPSTTAFVTLANDGIAQDAAQYGARVADAFTPFNSTDLATFCALGPFCPPTDVHPTDTGYTVIATQFWTASGYARLQD